jgi:hypothetical protein
MTETEGRATGRQLYIVRCAVSKGAIGIFWCDGLAALQVEADKVATMYDDFIAPYTLEYSQVDGDAVVSWIFGPGPRVGVDLDDELSNGNPESYFGQEVTNGLTFESGLNCYFGAEVNDWQPLASN